MQPIKIAEEPKFNSYDVVIIGGAMIGAAVAMHIFTKRICEVSGYSMDYIQKGSEFYYKSE